MSLKFKVAAVIPATPQQVYDAWLDSDVHFRMTGSRPARTSTKGGGEFQAWDCYIKG